MGDLPADQSSNTAIVAELGIQVFDLIEEIG